MAVNKVTYGGETLIDLTGDTVQPQAMMAGYTAHAANGEVITGSLAIDQTVIADSQNPVSGAAVAAYAFPKDMIVATTVDPGEGAVVDYPDGTVILVYE